MDLHSRQLTCLNGRDHRFTADVGASIGSLCMALPFRMMTPSQAHPAAIVEIMGMQILHERHVVPRFCEANLRAKLLGFCHAHGSRIPRQSLNAVFSSRRGRARRLYRHGQCRTSNRCPRPTSAVE
jgi:hypothetical protein